MNAPTKNSLERTGDAGRFTNDGSDFLSWTVGGGENPGASLA